MKNHFLVLSLLLLNYISWAQTLTVPTTQNFCAGATVLDLASNPSAGATTAWYTASTGGIALAPTDSLFTATYYVEQTIPESIITLGSGFFPPSGFASGPWDIAIQTDGKIVVTDYGNNAVKRMGPNGENIETLGSGFSGPSGVAIQTDGKIVVADYGNNAIKRMRPNGEDIETLGSGFSGPHGVAIQADGKIVVANYWNNAINRMGPNGENIETLCSEFEGPGGVAIQADGKIVVADYWGDVVKRMDPNGENIETLGSGFYRPSGVAIQTDGKIVVAGGWSHDVKRMDAYGGNIETLGSGFEGPYGVAIQADGAIVVADYGDGVVKRITEAKVSGRVAVSVTVNVPPAPAATTPQVFCNSAKVVNLTATGTAIQWYDKPTDGSPLSGATTLVPGNTYYASQTLNSCESTRTAVTVAVDIALPVVVTKNITLQLDASGNASIVPDDVNNGSSDNCGITTLALDKTAFTCANLGSNTVKLTVTDANVNASFQTATVTVEDKVAPVVVTKNITLQLDASGNASIVPDDVNNGSSDNCGITTLALDKTAFTCANLGPNTMKLTVTDANGNTSFQTATVTVEDKVAPVVVTKNITLQLDASGNASIVPADVNNGSSDNCGIGTLALDKTVFTCANLGPNTVKLTVTDANVNTSFRMATVTVINNFGDNDSDGIKDNCDDDDDNDGIQDVNDNCSLIVNANQFDNDHDSMGDSCDDDNDNDGVLNTNDNSPMVYNPEQEDRDYDGLGDVSDLVEINVSEAITPNGDGINDTWFIYNIENYPNATVSVFNRYGAKVFSAKNYQNDWDGHYKNKAQSLPDSSYYYQIDFEGDSLVDKEGWIYIGK